MDGYIRKMVFARNVRGDTAYALCASGCAHSLGAPAGAVGRVRLRARGVLRAKRTPAAKRCC